MSRFSLVPPGFRVKVLSVPPDEKASGEVSGEFPDFLLTLRLPKGENGTPGVDGTNGKDGLDGKDGRPGQPGVTGLQRVTLTTDEDILRWEFPRQYSLPPVVTYSNFDPSLMISILRLTNALVELRLLRLAPLPSSITDLIGYNTLKPNKTETVIQVVALGDV